MRKLSSVWAAVALVLLTAGVALASEGEGPRWGDFSWRVLNLILFAAILWKFTGKLIVNFLTGRREGIRQELADLDVKRAEAEKRLAEIEAHISNLDAERKAILEEGKAQAEAGRKAILAEAEKQAQGILDQARRTAENEGRAVLAQVRAAIADEIVDTAEKVLASKLDNSKHGKLIEHSLSKVVLN